jgi:hypothetical protein
MELEVRSLDSSTRKELTKKVRQYKASLNSLDEDYQRVKEKEERDGLLGGHDGMGGQSIEMRGRMRSATEKYVSHKLPLTLSTLRLVSLPGLRARMTYWKMR